MKKLFLLLLCTVLFLFLSAQNPVPNPGFENWSGNPLSPVSWYSNGAGSNVLITKVTGYNSSSAAQGNVISFNGGPLVAPYLGCNFPVNQRFVACHFYYKALLDSDDVFQVSAAIYDSSNNFLAGNYFNIVFESSTFTHFNLVLDSLGNGIPDHALITFTIIPLAPNPTPHINSFFVIDDVELSNDPTGIKENTISDIKIFPNPSNNIININGNWNEKTLHLGIYDLNQKIVLQKNVTQLLNGKISELINIESINPGIYFLKLSGERKNYYVKLIVE